MKISRWSDLKCHRTSRLGSNVMLGDTKYFNREKALDLVLLYRCRVPEYGSNAYSGDAGLPAIDPSRININTAIICPAIRSSSPQLRLLEENEFSSFRLLRAKEKRGNWGRFECFSHCAAWWSLTDSSYPSAFILISRRQIFRPTRHPSPWKRRTGESLHLPVDEEMIFSSRH